VLLRCGRAAMAYIVVVLLRFCGAFAVMMVTGQCSNGNAAAAIVASSGTACKIRHPWATAGDGAASSARHHDVCCTICKVQTLLTP
jgi:hypothetical protein